MPADHTDHSLTLIRQDDGWNTGECICGWSIDPVTRTAIVVEAYAKHLPLRQVPAPAEAALVAERTDPAVLFEGTLEEAHDWWAATIDEPAAETRVRVVAERTDSPPDDNSHAAWFEWLTVPGRTFSKGGVVYAVVPDEVTDGEADSPATHPEPDDVCDHSNRAFTIGGPGDSDGYVWCPDCRTNLTAEAEAEPVEPQWQVTVTVPDRVVASDRDQLFNLVAAVAYAWEENVDAPGKDWDIDVSGSPAPKGTP